jgi:hypothetical protein
MQKAALTSRVSVISCELSISYRYLSNPVAVANRQLTTNN